MLGRAGTQVRRNPRYQVIASELAHETCDLEGLHQGRPPRRRFPRPDPLLRSRPYRPHASGGPRRLGASGAETCRDCRRHRDRRPADIPLSRA
ncbi:hypothetical protein RHECNPAF_1740014 [Rhizobium etli CNPAF512]|nr:hypothetical protein RHECNPAF_1740014 [Rhizobium etli CNPAF512]